MKNCWKILNIDPTDDKKSVKKAYAKLLRITQPEDDPENFQILRTAYEQAMVQAENGYFAFYNDTNEIQNMNESQAEEEDDQIEMEYNPAIDMSDHFYNSSENQPSYSNYSFQYNDLSETVSYENDQFLVELNKKYIQSSTKEDLQSIKAHLNTSDLFSLESREIFELRLFDWVMEFETIPHELLYNLDEFFDWGNQLDHLEKYSDVNKIEKYYDWFIVFKSGIETIDYDEDYKWSSIDISGILFFFFLLFMFKQMITCDNSSSKNVPVFNTMQERKDYFKALENAKSRENHEQYIQDIFKHSKKTELKDIPVTYYDYKKGNQEIFKLIINNDAIAIKSFCQKNDINQITNELGRTPLMIAILQRKLDLIHLFMKNEQSLLVKDSHGWNAIHIGAFVGNLSFLTSSKIPKHFVNIQTNDGRTALHLTIEGENDHIVELLMKSGASLWVENTNGKTPLDIARRLPNSKNKDKIIQILENK